MEDQDFDKNYQKGRPMAPCADLRRTLPIGCPEVLPFEPTKEKIPKLEEWLVDYLSESSFNTYTQQKLPLWLHVKPDAKPVAIHKAGSIPIYMTEQLNQTWTVFNCTLGVFPFFRGQALGYCWDHACN